MKKSTKYFLAGWVSALIGMSALGFVAAMPEQPIPLSENDIGAWIKTGLIYFTLFGLFYFGVFSERANRLRGRGK